MLPLFMFSLWYKVNLVAVEPNEKCVPLRTRQCKFVYHFWFSTIRTFKQALIIYYLDYCSILASCCLSCITLFQCILKVQQLRTSCLRCLHLDEPHLYASSDSCFVFYPVSILCYSVSFLHMFYCIVHIISALLMIITPLFCQLTGAFCHITLFGDFLWRITVLLISSFNIHTETHL